MSWYALVDCNNFFVSCERVFRPELAHRPVAVLSNNDGCIIARSNEVKALGITMGAPLFTVRELVRRHDVTLFSANFELYGDMSQRIIALLREEVPLIEVYSIDEAFLDLSSLPIGDKQAWAQRLRQRIWREIGIPVSIGVAPTKTLAKVASTAAKHADGVVVVGDDVQRAMLLRALPIEELWGIGRRLAPKLRDRGITTAGQLVGASDAWLEQQLTLTTMRMVRELRGEACLGFGDAHSERKMIMRSRSFGHTVRAYHQLEGAVATFAARAAVRLREQDSLTRQVAVMIATGKHTDSPKRFGTVVSLAEPTNDTARIITAALTGLEGVYQPEFGYKRAAVWLLDIVGREAWQLSLLEPVRQRDDRDVLMQTLDRLNRRYGAVLWHAAERRQDTGWHSKHELRSPRYTTSWAELPLLH